MKQACLGVIGAAGLFLLARPCPAQTDGSAMSVPKQTDEAAVRKTLQQLYDKCALATKNKNEQPLAEVRAADFICKAKNGKTLNKTQMESEEKRDFSEIQTVDSMHNQIDSLTMEGDRATTTVKGSFAGSITYKTGPHSGTPHRLTLETTTRDVWTQTDSKWTLKSVDVVTQQMTLDGQPYDPTAARNNKNSTNHVAGNGRNNNGRSHVSRAGYRSSRVVVVPRLPHVPAPKIPKVNGHHHKRK